MSGVSLSLLFLWAKRIPGEHQPKFLKFFSPIPYPAREFALRKGILASLSFQVIIGLIQINKNSFLKY
jgi:hypothetical protein